MTKAERDLMQSTHDAVIRLETIIIGNGVEGLAKRVKGNSDFIIKIKDLPKIMKDQKVKIEKHDRLYYKTMGGVIVLIVVIQIIMKYLNF